MGYQLPATEQSKTVKTSGKLKQFMKTSSKVCNMSLLLKSFWIINLGKRVELDELNDSSKYSYL